MSTQSTGGEQPTHTVWMSSPTIVRTRASYLSMPRPPSYAAAPTPTVMVVELIASTVGAGLSPGAEGTVVRLRRLL